MNKIPEKRIIFISLINTINTNSSQLLLGTIANARAQNPELEEVHLLLSTLGGNVNDGINVFNILRAMPLRIYTYNAGRICSIGNVVFLAGE